MIVSPKTGETVHSGNISKKVPTGPWNMLGCPRKLGSMVGKWVISPTYKWGIPWGYNPLILTIDPNLLWDIHVEHTPDLQPLPQDLQHTQDPSTFCL